MYRWPTTAARFISFLAGVAALSGCQTPPETVPFVDLDRYAGRWYQVAGYPFGPTRGLVGITADYALLQDGKVRVVNTGYEGSFDGPVDTIMGEARVVDEETNAKLLVRFPSVLGGIFPGQYWIIDLDEENYSYAAVSDSFRWTLFILSRTPQIEDEALEGILARIEEKGYELDRIERVPQPE